jgi:hypothetical protein
MKKHQLITLLLLAFIFAVSLEISGIQSQSIDLANRAPNLLTNPGFETGGLSPWRFFPTQGNNCSWTTIYDGAYEGVKMLSMQRPNSNPCSSLTQDVQTAPQSGQVYSVTFYGRRGWDGSARTGRLAIWALGGSEETSATNFSLDGQWRCFVTTLNVTHGGHTAVRAEVYLDSVDPPDYQVDNFILNQGTQSCPLDPTATPTITPVADATPCPLSKPLLYAPPDQTIYDYTQVGNLTFDWQSICDAVKYKLKVRNEATGQTDAKANLTPQEANCNTLDCSFTIAPLVPERDTTYSWFIKVQNSTGETKKSERFSFTINTTPGKPVLTSPCNGGSTLTANPALVWNASTSTTEYILTIKDADNQKQLEQTYAVDAVCAGATCSVTLGGELAPFTPEEGKTYSWQVKADNGVGKPKKSKKWTLTGNTPVKTVLLQFPNDQTGVANPNPYLQWQADARITDYRVEVLANGARQEISDWGICTFEGNPVQSDPLMTCPAKVCEYQIQKPLVPDTTYTWQVTGRTATEKVKSPWWRFNRN